MTGNEYKLTVQNNNLFITIDRNDPNYLQLITVVRELEQGLIAFSGEFDNEVYGMVLCPLNTYNKQIPEPTPEILAFLMPEQLFKLQAKHMNLSDLADYFRTEDKYVLQRDISLNVNIEA